jgi:hypothetical protein
MKRNLIAPAIPRVLMARRSRVMTVETPKTTTEPNDPASAIATAERGCCGGEAAAESRNDASERADHEHHAHAAPSKAAPSSCCCGATKESSPADRKSRDAASE